LLGLCHLSHNCRLHEKVHTRRHDTKAGKVTTTASAGTKAGAETIANASFTLVIALSITSTIPRAGRVITMASAASVAGAGTVSAASFTTASTFTLAGTSAITIAKSIAGALARTLATANGRLETNWDSR